MTRAMHIKALIQEMRAIYDANSAHAGSAASNCLNSFERRSLGSAISTINTRYG